MSFYQNILNQEFRGTWILGDRQYSIDFNCPANRNTPDYQLAFNSEPYDFSVVNTLTFNYAYDADFKNYSSLGINVAGVTAAATTAAEVVALLNANVTFAESWVAQVTPVVPTSPAPSAYSVLITSKPRRPKAAVRLWITNAGAEQKLRFNAGAGVAELPTYMDKHTVANRFAFADSQACLVKLDETDATVDRPIITAAGFDYSAMKADWQLLAGRSGLFTFKKQTVDGSNRVTMIIEYPAGAKAGDFARKTKYAYTAANTFPDKITEEPYQLVSADLVVP